MKKLICYILVYIFVQTIPFNASALVVGYSRVFGSGCGAVGDNNILGQLTDLSAETTMVYWWASKYTSTSASDCVGRIKALLTDGSNPESADTFGYAVYAHNVLGYPDGSTILASGTFTEDVTGNAQAIVNDFTEISLANATIYWVAIIEPGGFAKFEVATSGGAGVRYMEAETTASSPPTDWSGSTEQAAWEFSVELTY